MGLFIKIAAIDKTYAPKLSQICIRNGEAKGFNMYNIYTNWNVQVQNSWISSTWVPCSLHSSKFEDWLNVLKRSTQINNAILLLSYFYPPKVDHAHAKKNWQTTPKLFA